MKRFWKKILYSITALVLIYLLLLIPGDADKGIVTSAVKEPFSWNRDEQWLQMEKQFLQAKKMQRNELDSIIAVKKVIAENGLMLLQQPGRSSQDSSWLSAENNFFILASLVAVDQNQLPWFIDYYTRFRNTVKLQSALWNMNEGSTRNTIYMLLYGMRAAVEEVLLQTGSRSFSAAMPVKNERSVTPVTGIFGIEVHSGDLLVSRGGAEVSALISRGNDYPGNFSHVALVYVDEKTNQPFLIEAHIEKGVAVASVAQYENDKKLRFMVMRPNWNLPQVQKDPMLVHKAAKAVYEEVARRHIPYDFKMDFSDPSKMFCSEVGSYAYQKAGIPVWKYPSSISSPGVVNWLHEFGVENFITQMPSDLEYDPQFSVVAEWRDPETLFKDHIDNAVMDVLLERANAGEKIGYNIWQLPVVRVIKGYCVIKNIFGKEGMIPEGMSAVQALKNQTFVAMHVSIKNKTQLLADKFIKENGYRPPYWQLVSLARQASGSGKAQ